MTALNFENPVRLTLQEHTERANAQLSADQARAIAHFRFTDTRPSDTRQISSPVVRVWPGQRPGTYTLLPGSVVGAFSVAGVDINVLPKVGIGKTVQLLAYNAGVARVDADSAAFSEARSLADLLAPAYLELVSRLVSQGLIEDYIVTEETGVRPRGTIDFSSLARRGIPVPVDYRYDDFTLDTPYNRLLYRGLHAVREMSGVASGHRAEARRLVSAFPEVPFDPAPFLYRGEPLPDRTATYRDAMALATMILDSVGIEPISGQVRTRGLLFDMNRVFEEFVLAVVKRAAPRNLTIDTQGVLRPRQLDSLRHYRLKPDFALWNGQECCLVGDVKYKVVDSTHRPRQTDLYQMVSYAAALRTRNALLFYTGLAENRLISIPSTDLTVQVCALNLDRDLAEVESSIATSLSQFSSD